jgi:hypothetical protein
VCPSGCAYTSIQTAIDAAAPGAVIKIGPGYYTENLVVDRSVTLAGAGNSTVLYPAVSAPTVPGCPGSLCRFRASTMILVEADNVTIEGMILEGNNPALTSGVVVGGVDIDARNGIEEAYPLGVFQHLVVSNVTVRDVYLRGIEPVSLAGVESFAFDHDTVVNVQGDPTNSIGIFNSGGTGSITNNRVISATFGIISNFSGGTVYSGNVVTNSKVSIQTVYNGDPPSSSDDVIENNTVSNCISGGSGISAQEPEISPIVTGNRITGCAVGLADYGNGLPGQNPVPGPVFSNNFVDGDGAATSDPAGTYGAYVTTDEPGDGIGDVNATFTGNTIQGFTTGLLVTQTSPTNGDTGVGNAVVAAHGNSFQYNGTGVSAGPSSSVDASGNWWGCAHGPNTPGCDTTAGTLVTTPFLASRPR